MKTIYLIRHCAAVGQEAEAKLTEIGCEQSEKLAIFLIEKKIDRIISSPYERAVQTIAPLAERLGMNIEKDDRLVERVLCATPNPNWLSILENSFHQLDESFEGGETSRDAMSRGVSVIEQVLHSGDQHAVIVTHGNLLSLILKHYDSKIGFTEWKSLSNPDVFKLTLTEHTHLIERIWI